MCKFIFHNNFIFMNFSVIFREKFKAALILFLLIGAIILSNIFEKSILTASSKSVKSIYQDRLKPSTDIYEMRELNDNHYILLEKALEDTKHSKRLKTALLQNEQQFANIIKQYEQTYLVKSEKAVLNQLKAQSI